MFLADPRAAYERALVAAGVLLGATAVLGGALFLENVVGVRPCHLCLLQRWPYYVGILLACAAVGTAHRGRRPAEVALAAAALVFAFGAAFGAYHSGVEAGLWAGPAGCTGDAAPAAGSADAFFETLKGTPPSVRCDAVSFRLLGLSLANWNVVASFALASLAAAGAVPRLRRVVLRPLDKSQPGA